MIGARRRARVDEDSANVSSRYGRRPKLGRVHMLATCVVLGLDGCP